MSHDSTITTETKPPAATSHYDLVDPPQPKPSSDKIRSMLATYYGELAAGFDDFNSTVSFGLYLSAINRLIADALAEQKNVKRLLSIGSGSGLRETSIRESSGLKFDITCVDISPEMCRLAGQRGLEAICGGLEEITLPAGGFDACMFVNAFEVLTNYEQRLAYFRIINQSLNPGGLFFIDAMDIENKHDTWANKVKEQFHQQGLEQAGYELGDCFCKRSDQDLIVFAHYSNCKELEQLFADSNFSIEKLLHVAEDTGKICNSGEGQMFFVAKKH